MWDLPCECPQQITGGLVFFLYKVFLVAVEEEAYEATEAQKEEDEGKVTAPHSFYIPFHHTINVPAMHSTY